MDTKKVIFSGCSFTAGDGWLDITADTKIENKDSPHLWVNLCYTRINRLNKLEMINIGKDGASNTEIFQNTVRSMAQYGDQIDTIFCQWTSMPRYNWNVGFELWSTAESFGSEHLLKVTNHDVNLNNGDHWPRKYINDLVDRFRVMHHLHWEIVKVVDYSNVIYDLAKKLGISNVFFMNGLCPWDQNYFVELDNVKPESYTEFTKTNILNMDNRDDDDLLKLYKLAHQHYQEAGGINPATWINLYSSLLNNKVDTNFDNNHPGVKSNILYYEMIDRRLKELGFI
jgi:hypothetical protein